MEQEIIDTLRAAFPDAQIMVELTPETERYNGRIISKSFEELSFLERQRRVFELLHARLGPEAEQISMLFTYTPHEYDLLQAAA